MSKHVHLAREYFTEGEIRDLLQNQSITKQNLHDFCRNRKVFYARDLERAEKCYDIARLFLDWNQFQNLAEKLDKERKKMKRRPIRLSCSIETEDIGKALKKMKQSRGEDMREEYTISDSTSARVTLNSQYVQVDPSKARYHQREQVDTELEIIRNDDGTSTLYYEDDQRGEAIARSFLGDLRKVDDKYLDKDLKEIDLSKYDSRKVTEFFLGLLDKTDKHSNASVIKVKLQKPNIEDSPMDEEDNTSAEDVVRHGLQNALLNGEEILQTSFYQSLKGEDYYISVMQWRFEDRAAKKKIVFEAGLKDPKELNGFYVEVTGIIEQQSDGEYSVLSRPPKVVEKSKYTDYVTDLAFSIYS